MDTRSLFTDVKFSVIWLIVRLYLGYQWLVSGWAKLTDPSGIWVGGKAGTAISGFFRFSLQSRTQGTHPDMAYGWYRDFIQGFALPNARFFSFLISYGEILVGVALILGALTAWAAFFGALMNFAYMLAGTAGVNPLMFLLGVLLVAAGANAGHLGFDRFLLGWRRRASPGGAR